MSVREDYSLDAVAGYAVRLKDLRNCRTGPSDGHVLDDRLSEGRKVLKVVLDTEVKGDATAR
jgi:hypothetical protein